MAAVAERVLGGDDLESDTEIRHRDRVTARLGWVARFRAIRERLEADSERPPPPPEGEQRHSDSIH